MRGGEKDYWLDIIPYYGGGHAWVCDGYQESEYVGWCTYLFARFKFQSQFLSHQRIKYRSLYPLLTEVCNSVQGQAKFCFADLYFVPVAT